MEKNKGEKENFFRKVYNVQKEQEDERKKNFEKIKNDKSLYAHVMNMYYIGWMWTLFPVIICTFLIVTNEIKERLATGILGIIGSLMLMVVYYVSFIKPLKK